MLDIIDSAVWIWTSAQELDSDTISRSLGCIFIPWVFQHLGHFEYILLIIFPNFYDVFNTWLLLNCCTARFLSIASDCVLYKTKAEPAKVKRDDCYQNLAWIFTDLTSPFALILDTHGGEAFTAVIKQQVQPIHLLVNNTAESWYWKARRKRALFTHTHANQQNQRICYVKIIYHYTPLHVPAALGNTLQTEKCVSQACL